MVQTRRSETQALLQVPADSVPSRRASQSSNLTITSTTARNVNKDVSSVINRWHTMDTVFARMRNLFKSEIAQSTHDRVPGLRETEEAHFISNNFCKKHCRNFVHDKTANERRKRKSDESYCHCGYPQSEHDDQAFRSGDSADYGTQHEYPQNIKERSWSTGDIAEEKTDAFGRIQFYPSDFAYRRRAKYVRLSDTTKMTDIQALLMRHWALYDTSHKPNMVVSLVGGGWQMKFSGSTKNEVLTRGLLKTVQTTKAWLICDGLNAGIGKQVGEVMKKGQVMQWNENTGIDSVFTCIGITRWSNVASNHLLNNTKAESLHVARYPVDQREGHVPLSLNPHYTHFLFVDDGLAPKDHVLRDDPVDFRVGLEAHINKPTAEGGLGVPVLLLLIEGGLSSVYHAVHAMLNGIAVVVGNGSGRAADLLAKVSSKIKKISASSINELVVRIDLNRYVDELVKELETLGKDSKFERTEHIDIRQLAEDLIEACCKHKAIYQFKYTTGNLEMALIRVFMSQQNVELMDQLLLTMQWNRADIAEHVITNHNKWAPNKRQRLQMMMHALENNQIDFVQLFIRNGFAMDEFLSKHRLESLYRRTALDTTDDLLWHLLRLKRGDQTVKPSSITLNLIAQLLTRLLRRFWNPIYEAVDSDQAIVITPGSIQPHSRLNDASTADQHHSRQSANPTNRISDLDMYLIEETDKSERMPEPYHDLFIWAILSFNKLESYAVELINQAFSINPGKAILLLHRPSAMVEGLDSLQLAYLADCKQFISTQCCQQAIWRKWKGDLDISFGEMLLGQFLFFPIFNLNCDSRGYLSMERPSQLRHATTKLGKRTLVRMDTVMSNNTLSSFETVSRISNQTYSEQCCGRDVLPWMKKVVQFYSAPMVKFSAHMFWYIVYLVLYAYVILVDYEPQRVWPGKLILCNNDTELMFERTQTQRWRLGREIFLYIWQFSIFVEILRQMAAMPSEKLRDRLGDIMSKPMLTSDVIAIIMSITAILFRWFSVFCSKESCHEVGEYCCGCCTFTFPVARLLMTLAYFPYTISLFKLHFTNSYLGPKIMVIKRMMWDLAMFCAVIIIFFACYSISTTALMHNNEEMGGQVFIQLFGQGVWEIFGEIDEDSKNGVVDDCGGANATTVECMLRSYPIPCMLMMYMLFGNILLLNMLIAVFTHIFEDVQANGQEIWKYNMHLIVTEFEDKPLTPAPFIIIPIAIDMIQSIFCCRRPRYGANRDVQNPKPGTVFPMKVFGHTIRVKEQEYLKIFECVCRGDMIDSMKRRKQLQLKQMVHRIDKDVIWIREHLQDVKETKATLAHTSFGGTSDDPSMLTRFMNGADHDQHPIEDELLQHQLTDDEFDDDDDDEDDMRVVSL